MAFTTDWDEATPTDATVANLIDDYYRTMRVDVSDRLKTLIYGFIAGENDGKPGCKNLIFKQQASAPSTPNADELAIYALDDGTNCGLYVKNEDGYTKQILKKVGTDIQLNLEAADITADSIDDTKIRLTNNGNLTSRNQAGDGDINLIKCNTSNLPEILVGAVLSADTAPATDAAIANKKYVDAKTVFGAWAVVSQNASKGVDAALAATAGFFIGMITQSREDDKGARIYGYTDDLGTNPPTTIRGQASVWSSRNGPYDYNLAASFMIPVAKGAYYKAVYTEQAAAASEAIVYYWMPVGA